MKKFLGVLLGLGLVVASELWGFDGRSPAQVKPKPSIFVVCNSNGSLVQEVTTSAPVVFTTSAVGAEGTVYYSVYQLSSAVSCATLLTDSEQPGPYPAGINLEADTTHKPVLK